MIVGVPVAIGVALFISHYATRRAATALGGMVDLLAAVPSLVFGMWGLYFLIPKTQGFQKWLSDYFGWIPIFDNQTATTVGPVRQVLLIAGMVLAIMIIPIVSAVSREVFLQVPRETIDAAWALGATKWEMIRTAVLPFGRAGIISAAMLGPGPRARRDHRGRAGAQLRLPDQLASHRAGRRHLRLDHRAEVRRGRWLAGGHRRADRGRPVPVRDHPGRQPDRPASSSPAARSSPHEPAAPIAQRRCRGRRAATGEAADDVRTGRGPAAEVGAATRPARRGALVALGLQGAVRLDRLVHLVLQPRPCCSSSS